MEKMRYCPHCGQERKNEEWAICPYCGNQYEKDTINPFDTEDNQTVDEIMADLEKTTDELIKEYTHKFIANTEPKTTNTIKFPTSSFDETQKQKISLSQQLNENLNKEPEKKLSEIQKKKKAIAKRRRRIGAIIGAIVAICAISSLSDIEPTQYITIWLPVTLMFAGVGYGIATLFGDDPWV